MAMGNYQIALVAMPYQRLDGRKCHINFKKYIYIYYVPIFFFFPFYFLTFSLIKQNFIFFSPNVLPKPRICSYLRSFRKIHINLTIKTYVEWDHQHSLFSLASKYLSTSTICAQNWIIWESPWGLDRSHNTNRPTKLF